MLYLTAFIGRVEITLDGVDLASDLDVAVGGEEVCGLDEAVRELAGGLGLRGVTHAEDVGDVFCGGDVAVLRGGGRQEGTEVGGVLDLQGDEGVVGRLCGGSGGVGGKSEGEQLHYGDRNERMGV